MVQVTPAHGGGRSIDKENRALYAGHSITAATFRPLKETWPMKPRQLNVAIATAGLVLLSPPALALVGPQGELTDLAGRQKARPDPISFLTQFPFRSWAAGDTWGVGGNIWGKAVRFFKFLRPWFARSIQGKSFRMKTSRSCPCPNSRAGSASNCAAIFAIRNNTGWHWPFS